MRDILRALMTAAGETAYDLEARTGIRQPTTYRFLNGSHGEPKAETIRRWAKAYGVTEAQLRGEAPIPEESSASMNGLFDDTLEQQAEQQPQGGQRTTTRMAKRTATKQQAREDLILAAEKRSMLALMNSIGKDSRQALLQMGTVLSKLHQQIQDDRRQIPDRRTEQKEPNDGRRWGEQFRDPLVRAQHRHTDQRGERKQAVKK